MELFTFVEALSRPLALIASRSLATVGIV